MLVRRNKLDIINVFFSIGLIFVLFSTQGILNYFILSKLGLGFLKSYYLEIGFFFILLSFILKIIIKTDDIKFTKVEFLLLLYIFFINIIMVYKINNISAILYSFKEVSLIFIIILIYKFFDDSIKEKKHFIVVTLLIFSILNLASVFLSYIIGYREYLEFLTGEVFYANSEVLNFKVSHFYSYLRSPALVGNSASFGFFSFFSFIIILNSSKKKYCIIPLLNGILSLTRSVYLSFFIFLLFAFVQIIRKKKHELTYKKILIIILAIILFIIFLSSYFLNIQDSYSNIINYLQNITMSESLYARFNVWNNIIHQNVNKTFIDILIGGGYGYLGTANNFHGSRSYLSIFDNAWLFLYFNIGIIGIALVIIYFISREKNNINIIFMIISISASMYFINLFQGEVVIAMMPITLFILESK
ncbi:MAG: hypothetical protein ACOCP8_03205 [archaeon]